MRARAKRRRSRTSPLTRGLIAAGTGCAVIGLPLVAATTASAQTPATHLAAKAAPAHRAAESKRSPQIYTVVPGDYLAKIARTHSLRGGWKRLYWENREAIGNNPSLIHPGLKLTLGGQGVRHKAHRTGAATKPAAEKKAWTTARNKAAAGGTSVNGGNTELAASSTPVQTAAPTYANNLDGWIRESLAVMAQHDIPGSYNGIYRNVMRESSGNPMAINNWDSNAAAGTPSKGLLQVIAPTFATYHVPGTSFNMYDPVANITAACNYAAHRYGSIDNVNGPY